VCQRSTTDIVSDKTITGVYQIYFFPTQVQVNGGLATVDPTKNPYELIGLVEEYDSGTDIYNAAMVKYGPDLKPNGNSLGFYVNVPTSDKPYYYCQYTMSPVGLVYSPILGILAYGIPMCPDDQNIQRPLPQNIVDDLKCSDTSCQYFGGKCNSKPWVLCPTQDTRGSVQKYVSGNFVSGTQRVVSFPDDTDWIGSKIQVDNVGFVGVGITPDPKKVPTSTGPLTLTCYTLSSGFGGLGPTKLKSNRTYTISNVNGSSLNGQVQDVIKETGTLWVIWKNITETGDGVETYVFRFVFENDDKTNVSEVGMTSNPVAKLDT